MTSDREKIARIIDPICFKAWQSLYDYCLPQDGEETARLYADQTHKAECDAALAKADAILALSPPAVGDVVERVAVALWLDNAKRAAPNVAKYRDASAFREQQDGEIKRWLGQARAAIAAMNPPIASLSDHPLNTKPVVDHETGSDVTQTPIEADAVRGLTPDQAEALCKAAEFLDSCAGTELEMEGVSAQNVVYDLVEQFIPDEWNNPFHEDVRRLLALALSRTEVGK